MRKILLTFAVLTLIVPVALVFAGCGNRNRPPAPEPILYGTIVRWEPVTFGDYAINYRVRARNENGSLVAFIGPNLPGDIAPLNWMDRRMNETEFDLRYATNRRQMRTIEIMARTIDAEGMVIRESRWATIAIPETLFN